jgi:hypothetical protein
MLQRDTHMRGPRIGFATRCLGEQPVIRHERRISSKATMSARPPIALARCVGRIGVVGQNETRAAQHSGHHSAIIPGPCGSVDQPPWA